MLETRKVDTQDTQGAFRKSTSIRYVTGTRYSENMPEVQVCRNTVVNK